MEEIIVIVKQELKCRIEDWKNIHSERTKNSLQQNSVKEVWSGMRKTAG